MGAKFAIVGTFEDRSHQCSETIQDKEATLEKILEPYKDFQVRCDNNIILPVDAITTDKEERRKSAMKLRKLIISAAGVAIKVQVKLRWFGFLLTMLTRSNIVSRKPFSHLMSVLKLVIFSI